MVHIAVCTYSISKSDYRRPVRHTIEMYRERASKAVRAGVNNTVTVRTIVGIYRSHALVSTGSHSCTMIIHRGR